MNPETIIVRFETVAEQTAGPVVRITGFARARSVIPLLDAADLEANPRSAKVGPVTHDILDSINDTPGIFVFKTKGILVGASYFEKLQRNRYSLSFENTKIEGILDGGHNSLALGIHILNRAVGQDVTRKIKRWPDFKLAWEANRAAVETLRKIKPEEKGFDETALDFLVPIEILAPSDVSNHEVVDEFNHSLLSICSARNNNVQLTLETKAAKKGFYEILRKALPTDIDKRVEWKTNDGGEVKARDLVAMSWIPLSCLQMEDMPSIPPQNIYRNKGECAKIFDELMSRDDVSQSTDGEYTREITNHAVISALKIGAQIPNLYDYIYERFPYAYNKAGGKFGNISVVRPAADMRSQPKTYFTHKPVEYSYPDGLIMPLVYGLKAMMALDENGDLYWTQEPVKFLDEHLHIIVKKYRVVLDAFKFDPQKVGKNEGSYDLVLDAFETQLMKETYDLS